MQHRLVAERVLGRSLLPLEVVHHEDENKQNNALENLWLFPSQSAHMRHHKRDCPVNNLDTIERLRAIAQGPPVLQYDAAKELRVSVPTLRNILVRYNIPWKNVAETQLTEETVRAALRGRSTLEAADHLGVCHQTLRSRFDHLLEKRVSPGSLEDHKEEIRSLAKNTRSDRIGELFGVNPLTVRIWIQRWSEQEPDAWSEIRVFQRSRSGVKHRRRRKA